MAKILVVDDESGVRNVLCRFLSLKGFETLEAENGRTAIQMMSSCVCQVALLDMNMPDTDTLELLKKLLEINNELVAILISGSQDDDKINQAISFGAAGFIMKPFDFSKLVAFVTSKLQ